MRRLASLILMMALVAAGCGGSSESDAAASTTSTQAAPTTTQAPTTTTKAPTTTTTEAPTTTTSEATTTTAAAAEIVPGEDADVDAIVQAFEIALDSVSSYEDKAGYIDDPSGLEGTVEKYLTTGAAMGGIEVAPTAVAVDGDTAVVTYDLLFGGNPTYPDLTGPAIKMADGWKITREAFCSLMSSARVGCP